MTLKSFVDRFIDPKPAVARAIDRLIARERKKERRRKARLERRRTEIRKIGRRVDDA